MKITILDPALCCNTGVCGPNVDDALVQTAANVKWLKSLRYDVIRHNISNDGAAFKEYPDAVERLKAEGVDSLPFILINDRMVKTGGYPTKEEWMQLVGAVPSTPSEKNIPAKDQSFKRTEILIGIGAAIAASNESSVSELVSAAKKMGIEIEEIALAINIGNEAKSSLNSRVISRANTLLKDLQPAASSCTPSSGCC